MSDGNSGAPQQQRADERDPFRNCDESPTAKEFMPMGVVEEERLKQEELHAKPSGPLSEHPPHKSTPAEEDDGSTASIMARSAMAKIDALIAEITRCKMEEMQQEKHDTRVSVKTAMSKDYSKAAVLDVRQQLVQLEKMVADLQKLVEAQDSLIAALEPGTQDLRQQITRLETLVTAQGSLVATMEVGVQAIKDQMSRAETSS
ncbi:hypothetical protein C8A00DRAFT_28933 [Chaetomidium leptoderma]|uniref:Uncharacterized protein n=1 Tax=Chaetomidium leptoderma TaxID=669021 RepID=A0AAN6VV72_9PEZI|nr:hypothetical protein C8A00DRAFT_28933 [Chaetomidium leptoderma]